MNNQFYEMLEKLKNKNERRRCVVVGANDNHALEAVFAAEKEGIVYPVLVGKREAVSDKINELGLADRDYEIVDSASESPAEKAIDLIKKGKGDFILKGKIETKDLLKPVVNKETGLNKSGFITHFGLMQLKSYHKLLAMSDAAVIPHPTLLQKEQIINAAVKQLEKLGIKNPIIGALCAAEGVNPKIPETVDAEQLTQWNESGRIKNCRILGPISYDLATNKESAAIKGYDKSGAGDVDMLLVPEMVTGNVMSKIWNVDSENILAGCLIGADVPIALTSRSASASEKLYSMVLCCALS